MNRVWIIIFIVSVFQSKAQTSAIQLGDSLYLHGNYTKAIAAYKNHENQDEVYKNIAKSYRALGIFDEALLHYENSLKVDPRDALTLFDYGKLLAKVKKTKEALTVFYQLIDIDYRNPNYHYESGLVLQQLNDSTSQNRFHNAYDLDHTHQKAIFQIAKFHLIKRHHNTVDKYIDIGLKSYANNKELISLKAQNYYWKKDYETAAIWFEKLLALNESTQFVHEKLSFCYARSYEPEKAIKHQLIALKFDPKNEQNLFSLGQLYIKVNDFKNAEKYVKQALIIMDRPLNEEYVKLATIYNLQNRNEEAIAMFKRAIAENPQNVDSHFFLVLTLDKYYEDVDARIKLYEDFNKKFPDHALAQYALERISKIKEEKHMKTD